MLASLALALPAEPAWAQGPESASKPDEEEPPQKASDDHHAVAADKEEDEEPLIEVQGRVHAGWTIERYDDAPVDDADQISNTFLVRRARLKVTGRPTDWMRGVVNIDASAILELGSSVLKDAYIHVQPLPQLELRVGQFKKPFSRLELRSPADLKVIERGDGNEFIVEDLGYGDRDLGIRASGRLLEAIRLRYMVGLFNGSGPNYDDTDGSKDFVARIDARPAKWIRPGLNASVKLFSDPEEGQPENAWAAGMDLRLKVMDLRLHLEALVAEDHEAWRSHPDEPDFTSPISINAFGILSQRHDFDVSWGFALEPVLKVEFLDPDVDVVSDDVLSFTPGINAYFGEYLRLMAQGEVRKSLRNSDDSYENRKTFSVLGCVDF